LGVCLVMEKKTEDDIHVDEEIKSADGIKNQITGTSRAAERLARKRLERYTYLVAAIMSSLGVTSMAAISVYYRFSWQMEVHKLRLSIN
jgi:beta-carotene 3-hydroxylase